MPKLFTGFKQEWRHLFTNKILLISSIVMLIIPILYGGFFLGSIWDPYGKTQNLPIAVVNEDKSVELQEKTVAIGDDIVASLKENHSLKWEFVSDEQAKRGMDSGYYYMTIKIPSDFSQNATSVTSANPKKSQLFYTVTPSKNYIGSLISNQAAEKVVENVRETLTKSYATALLANVDKLKDGMNQAASRASQLSSGSSQLASGLTTYTNGVATLADGQNQLNSGINQLASGSSQLASGLNQMNSQLPTVDQIGQLQAGAAQIQQGLNQLNTQVSQPNSQAASLVTDATKLGDQLQNFQTLAASKTTALTNFTIATKTAVATAQPTVTMATTDAADTLAVLGAAKQIITDTGALLGGLQTFSSSLGAQQKALQSGVGQLAAGMNQFAPNNTKALAGYNTLRAGATQLSTGAKRLNNGLLAAQNGSNQLVSGTSQLNANSPTLISGASQLQNGVATLADKLGEAASQLSIQPTGEPTASQISAPLSAAESKKGDVPNYGFALAPYVLALGLYVGALVFSVIYPVRMMFGKPRTAFDWFVGKWTVSSAVAVGQVLILGGVMTLVLGLKPVDPIGFFTTLLVTSWAFMAIVLFLAIALNNPGRFIAMLLLVLQLGGSEGTFPIVTAPSFFQAINNFLPMTYSIRALRQAISGDVGGVSIIGNIWILVVVALIANLALYLVLFVHKTKPFAHASVDGG